MPLSGPPGVTSAAMVGYCTLSAVPLQSPKIPPSTTIKFSISCFFFRPESQSIAGSVFLLPTYPQIFYLTFGREARSWKHVCSDADCRAGWVRWPLNEPLEQNTQELTETGSQICAQTTPRQIHFGTHSRCNVHLAERLIRSLWLSADLYILSAVLPEGQLADHECRRTTR